MINKKYINLFAGGIIALLPLGNLRMVNLATPSATPFIIKLQKIKLEFTNKRAELGSVQITAKDATSITVNDSGKTIKVDIASATHFRRKFWGASNLNEISVGDTVNVIGRWTSEDRTEINAVLVRDLSIQKRNGVFFGTVKTITDTGFVMTTIQRGDETVTLDPTTRLLNRKGQAITPSDIQVGQTIRVRGMWNSTTFTITEVTEVKDFSLPVSPSPTP